jgi:hypothetical protein
LREPFVFVGVGHHGGPAGDDQAPAGPGRRVELVRLEGDDDAVDGVYEVGVRRGAQQDGGVRVQGEVDGQDRGQRVASPQVFDDQTDVPESGTGGTPAI